MADWAAMAAYAKEEGQEESMPQDEVEEKEPNSGIDYAAAARAAMEPDTREQLLDDQGATAKINTTPFGEERKESKPIMEGGLVDAFNKEMEAWGEAIDAGWDNSLAGMAIQKEVGGVDPDMKTRHAFLREVTSAVIDLPVDLVAAVPGAWAGPVGGVASSAAITSGMRQWLVDEYGQGHTEPMDVQGRLFNVLKASAAGAAGGVIGGKVGSKVFSKVAPRYGSKVAAWASNPMELAAMSTSQSLIQHGQLPSAQDFKAAALSMVAGKTVGAGGAQLKSMYGTHKLQAKAHMETKLQHIYAQTGKRPEQVYKMAQDDPHLRNQLMESKIETPDALKHLDVDDIMSKVDDGSREPGSLKEGLKAVKNDAADAFVDDLSPIKRAFNKLMGSDDAAEKVSAQLNTYKMARLARGWAGKFEHLMEHGGWNNKTGQIDGSKGLIKLLREVDNPESGTSLLGFAKYMTSRRTMEKEGQFFNERRDYRTTLRDLKREQAMHDPKSGDHYKVGQKIEKLTGEYKKLRSKRDANEHTGMKQFDNKKTVHEDSRKYGEFEREFQAFNRSLLRQLEQSGVMSHDDYVNITEKNQSYVPFQRLMDDLVKMDTGVKGKPKAMEGSGRPVRNPFEAYVEGIQKNLQAVEHNTVLQHLRKLDVGSEVLKERPLKDSEKTINQVAKEQGVEPSEVSAHDLMKSVKGEAKSMIYGFENGKRTAYEVDHDIARAFDNLTGRGYKLINTDNPVVGTFWKIMKMPADALRFGATTTPDFMVANLLRDVTSSFAFSKSNNAHIFSFTNGAIQMFNKEKSTSYKEMLRSGGQVMGQHRDGTSPHLNRDIYKELTQRPVKNLMSIEKLNQMKDRVSDLTEGAARMGEYLSAKDSGMSRLEAAYQHRDISLDFARAGYVGRYINDIVTFHNAGVQSLAKLHTVMTTGTVKERAMMGLKVFTGVTLPSIVFSMAFGDDERVQQVPQWERDLYWIVPAGDILMRIPKPHEVGVIFGSSIERAFDQMKREDPRTWQGYADSLASKMIPGGLGSPAEIVSSITALKPFIEAATNHNFFRETPLIPSYMEDIAPEFQYKEGTSEIARKVGGVFNKIGLETSPIVIDNFVQAWSGGVGKYVTGSIDTLLKDEEVRPGEGNLKTGKWGWDTWQELPVIKSFIARNPETTGRARAIDTFVERHQKALSEAKTISFLEKNFMFNDMRDRLSKRLWIKNDAAYNVIRDLQSSIHTISMLPPGTGGMSDKELALEKAQQIEKMYITMMKVAEAGLLTYDNIDKHLEE